MHYYWKSFVVCMKKPEKHSADAVAGNFPQYVLRIDHSRYSTRLSLARNCGSGNRLCKEHRMNSTRKCIKSKGFFHFSFVSLHSSFIKEV